MTTLLGRLWRPALYVLVPATLYATGLHTEVIGRAQQVVLATGLLNRAVPKKAVPIAKADYSLMLRTLDGRTVSLSQLRGKVILLNLWASWCPPCVAEMPSLQRLHDKVKPDNIALVVLSVDQNPEKARRFAARRGFTMPVYTLASELPQVFDTQVLPTTFIIAPNGDIIDRHEGMGDYDNAAMIRFLRQLQKDAQ
ncbi:MULTISPECIES: TlpA family protein disulfide reductase [Hymenobacter]|nr:MULTISPECIES: TlpA disulfide reductase family protein [Hymenobacter]MBC6989419.1 TlpA family protein disulfide reductase [Hymenobacter sp. BT491]